MEQQNLLRIVDCGLRIEKLQPSQKYLNVAEKRKRVVEALLDQFKQSPEKPRLQIISDFLANPANHPISRSTLYNWISDYIEGGPDALVPHYADGIPKISKTEQKWLLELLRSGFRVGAAIAVMKWFLGRRGTPSESSPTTLRRWARKHLQGARNVG